MTEGPLRGKPERLEAEPAPPPSSEEGGSGASSPPRSIRRQGLLRNIAWASSASVLVKPVWILFLVALCPRILGVEEYGTMQAALALAAIALTLADLGTSTLTLREVAARPAEGSRYFSNVLVLRLGVGGLCLAAALLAARVLGYDAVGTAAVAAAGGYLVAQQAVGYTRVFFRVAEDLRYEAASTVAERGLVVALGAALLLTTRSAGWTLAGMTMGAALVGLVQVRWVSRSLARFDRTELSLSFMRGAAWLAIPLGLADLLLALYSRVDLVMIGAIAGDRAAGQYGQAYRLFEALSLLPAIVVQSALFPRLSRMVAAGEGSGARQLARRTGIGLVGAGIVIAAVVWAVAPFLITALTGDAAFDPAADALRILVWTFPLVCAKDLLFITALAHRRYRGPVVVFGIAVAFNVGLNLWAIPRHGIVGASVATLASEILTVVLFLLLARRQPLS